VPTCHVFIAASLDGYIARPGGDLDWLDGWPAVGHDYGYGDFIASVDGVVMGRGTFEKVLTFPEWPYAKPVVVLSRSLRQGDLRADLAAKVRISAAGPGEIVADLDREGWKRACVDGGSVIQAFLREGLVADMVVTRIPILLGGGLPLFGPLHSDVRLTHLRTAGYASGFVQSHYAVDRGQALRA
jgi:dihydrofolate reductase